MSILDRTAVQDLAAMLREDGWRPTPEYPGSKVVTWRSPIAVGEYTIDFAILKSLGRRVETELGKDKSK